MSTLHTMRQDAIEGEVFYDNLENKEPYTQKYYPPYDGESQSDYDRRPKIAVSITTSTVDRIIGSLLGNMIVTSEDPSTRDVLDMLGEDLDFTEIIRDVVKNTIVGGNNLTIVHPGETVPFIKNWDAPFVYVDDNGLKGFEYELKDGVMLPVLKNTSNKKDDIVLTIINELVYGDEFHNLGFDPSYLTINIDRYKNGIVGKTFTKRFIELANEYNQVFSGNSLDIKIFKNLWTINKTFDDPVNKVTLTPGKICFIGEDGELQQAIKNLDLSEENEHLNTLEHHISRASQVPGEFTGLRDAGKLPSGVALTILMQPFVELLGRFEGVFTRSSESIITKIVQMNNRMQGRPAGDPQVSVVLDIDVVPKNVDEKIDQIILLKKEGLITEEEARIMTAPLIGLELNSGQA